MCLLLLGSKKRSVETTGSRSSEDRVLASYRPQSSSVSVPLQKKSREGSLDWPAASKRISSGEATPAELEDDLKRDFVTREKNFVDENLVEDEERLF